MPRSRSRSLSPYSRRALQNDRRPHQPRSTSPKSRPSDKDHSYRDRSPRPHPSSAVHNQTESPDEQERTRPKKQILKGFKFKETSRVNGHEEQAKDTPRGLERGYREQETQDRPEKERDSRVVEKFGPGADVRDKFGAAATTTESAAPLATGDAGEENKKEKKKKKDKNRAKIAPTNEPMIVVNVNDRLGTKASIPCLASDPIKLFKAQVAARIGRQPHEIMLKRQGERPFKEHLTLEDYGVSNGVQLDLEIDTGD